MTAKEKKTGTLKKKKQKINLVANEISLSAEGARTPSLVLFRVFFFSVSFFFSLDNDAAKREFKKYQDRNKCGSLRETRHPVGFFFYDTVFWLVTFFPKVTNPRVALEVT